MTHHISLILVASLVWLSTWPPPSVLAQSSSQAVVADSPEVPIRAAKSRLATYQVDFRVSVTPPKGTKRLQVWLPLPPSDGCQQIIDRKLSTFPRCVNHSIAAESEFGNRFAYFEFESPRGAQLISHQFKATIHQLDWNVDYHEIDQPKHWPVSFDPYLRADPRSKGSDDLRAVLTEIDSSNRLLDPTAGRLPTSRLLGAMRWVDKNLTYDHRLASLSADPTHALTHRRGHCSDYHGLCGTLAREIGYPSRVLYGLQMFDKGSPSHCKLEIFLPPYGWVRYDLSETQKLTLKQAGDSEQIKERTMRGFSENTWLLVTRGVNYELAPPASRRVPVVRTIYAEADGIPLPEPDPSNADQQTFSWMTMHRVDEIGDTSRRFQDYR